jgi:hypothetical protein
MKNDNIRNDFCKFMKDYEEYFKTNEEVWEEHLKNTKSYINKNNKLPSAVSKDKNIKFLGMWLSNQNTNYKKKSGIMKNEEIYAKFTLFRKDYTKYCKSNNDIFF